MVSCKALRECVLPGFTTGLAEGKEHPPSHKACIFNLFPSLCKRGQVRDPVARRLVGVRPQSVP